MPSSATEVRRATPDDLDDVARLYVELKRHHRPLATDNPRYRVPDDTWRDRARRVLSDPRTTVYLAEVDDNVVGFLELTFAEKPWGVSCEIETLVISDGYRRRGYGRALMMEAERRAREEGARGMRVDILAANAEGRRFYEGLGYELFAVRYGKPI